MSKTYMTVGEALKLSDADPAFQLAGLGDKIKYLLDTIKVNGKIWYVDSVNGYDTGFDGLSWDTPFKTIAKAVASASAGDTLMMIGTFTEAVTCTKQLKFIGAGNTVNDCVWMESAAGQTLLTLSEKDCIIQNIRFRIPTTGGIGIAITGSDYTKIQSCTFQGRGGSLYGITVTNGGSQLQILDNIFEYLNTTTTGTAVKVLSVATSVGTGWLVKGNTFHSNTNSFVCTLRQSQIIGNLFQSIGLNNDNSALTTTLNLDLSGSGGQFNTVSGNYLQGTYSGGGGYVHSALSDDWHNNYGPSGLTTSVPA